MSRLIPYPAFITDVGQDLELTSDTDERGSLPRYAVWVYEVAKGKYQVVETSNDLSALQKKYGPHLAVDNLGPKP